MSERLLIVSHRLPFTASLVRDTVRLTRLAGDHTTGLHNWRCDGGPWWIGWPGDVSAFSDARRAELEAKLTAQRVQPVYLSRAEVDRQYEGFSNRVLWPLFHYLVDRVTLDASGWEAYRHVNAKFADAIANAYSRGDMVWVHDHQLMLLPAMIRERIPEAQVGFFLHVPFPSSEVFRILPWRSELLRGVLGADLIGFHTFSFLRHFVAALLHVESIESDVNVVQVGGRRVRLGVYPMGVDAKAFHTIAEDSQVTADAEAIRADADGRKILLGVDRLDYTKGIPLRLLALERLLDQDGLRDGIRYIQIAEPARTGVESQQRFRREVEEAVGRINGAHSTVRSTPIHYLHRSVSQRELVALYRAADVMVVTPLRDGMNLVAKEFVASRTDADGVLVLSEFAGAASELGEALVVNPYDVDAVAGALRHALTMDRAERQMRMQNLRRRVAEQDLNAWADRFTRDLRGAAALQPPPRATRAELQQVIEALGNRPLTILLDYDGTLVPIARAPDLAAPDRDLLSLLEALAARRRTAVHLVSGRPRESFERWFAHLPIALWAEHGFWHRPAPAGEWRTAALGSADAELRRIYPILEQFTSTTPGSLIEEKSASLAWHYRMAEPEFGTRQAHELRMLLVETLSNQPLEVLEGKKVIEVRARGVNKALVSQRVLAAHDPAAAVVAIGDDRTDEDLFDALPASAITIAVGTGQTQGRYYVDDHRAVRELLRSLLG